MLPADDSNCGYVEPDIYCDSLGAGGGAMRIKRANFTKASAKPSKVTTNRVIFLPVQTRAKIGDHFQVSVDTEGRILLEPVKNEVPQ